MSEYKNGNVILVSQSRKDSNRRGKKILAETNVRKETESQEHKSENRI